MLQNVQSACCWPLPTDIAPTYNIPCVTTPFQMRYNVKVYDISQCPAVGSCKALLVLKHAQLENHSGQ